MDTPDRTADLPADPPTHSRLADPPTADPPPADPTGDHAPAPTATDPRPTIPGYSIDGELGTGGMGVVYRAVHRGLNRPAALKMVRGHDRADPRHLIRFLAEAEAVAAVQHPHVVRVYDFGHSDGRPYLAMELLPGGSLADRLRSGPLDPRHAAALLAKLAGAVQAFHDLGIVHRDLKPANVLFDAAGEPKVTDFGLAKRGTGSDLTATQAVMGTPAYMTPEQVAGGSKFVGPAADVYALGTVLYECLTDTRPFDGPDLPVLMRQIADDPPEPPRKRAPTLPRDIELVCLKCLEKRPADRYPSAAALADDLRRFAAGEPVSVRPAGLLERGYKWARRKPTVAALYAATAAGALLVAVAAAVGLLWREAVAERGNAESARDQLAGEKRLTEDALAKLGEEQGKTAAALTDAESARDLLRREQDKLALSEYARTMEVAHQEALGNNVAGAMALLEGTRPDLRGWEWRYVQKLCNGQRRTFPGQSIVLRTGACWSPDGSRLATTRAGDTARVWDVQTWSEVLTLNGRSKEDVGPPIWSPDGSKLATSLGERAACVWDARTGAELAILRGHTNLLSALAWSPDGSKLATSSYDETVRVWDARTWTTVAVLNGHNGVQLGPVSWSPDGQRVVAGSHEGTVRVWDAKTGIELVAFKGHTDAGVEAKFSPDGSKVVTGSMWDPVTRVWDAMSGAELATIKGHNDWVRSIRWSPDGGRLATASDDGTARVWDAKTGAAVAVLRGHSGVVEEAIWSPDGRRLATVSYDGTARVWDAAGWTEIAVLRGHRIGIVGAAWSPDGKQLVTGDGGTIRVWEVAPPSEVVTLSGHTGTVDAAAWNPDRSLVATTSRDRSARVWDARTGQMIAVMSGHSQLLNAVAWSPDGRRLATGSDDGTARVWDARTGAGLALLRGHLDRVVAIAWSPDGAMVATASHDGTARLWDASTGAEHRQYRGQGGTVEAVAYSLDGTRVTTASMFGGTVRLWDPATGTEVSALKLPGAPQFVAWSPDGQRLLVEEALFGAARVFDANTGAELAVLNSFQMLVGVTAWSPDGRRLATGSHDGTVRVWDPATGAVFLTLGERRGTPAVSGIAWNPDGSAILAVYRDGTLRTWDTTPTDPRFRGKVVAPPPRPAKR